MFYTQWYKEISALEQPDNSIHISRQKPQISNHSIENLADQVISPTQINL